MNTPYETCGPCLHGRCDLCFGPYRVGIACHCQHDPGRCLIRVTPDHVMEMAERMATSVRERALSLAGHPAAKLTYEQAVRQSDRRMDALRRLTEALARQGGDPR